MADKKEEKKISLPVVVPKLPPAAGSIEVTFSNGTTSTFTYTQLRKLIDTGELLDRVAKTLK